MASNKKPMKYDEALALASLIQERLVGEGLRVQICGSIRRKRPVVNDIDIVVSAPTTVVYDILKKKFPLAVEAQLTKNKDKYTNFLVQGVQVDFHYARPESWGAAVLFLTGSGLFNIVLRGIAKNQGYKLNEKGLFFGEDMIAGKTEEQIFDALGYHYLPPERREVTPENRKSHWLKEKEVV